MAQLRSRFRRPVKRGNVAGKEPWFIDMWRALGCACAYCQNPLKLSDATRDHVLPKSMGGSRRGNIVPACKRCNGSKGNQPVHVWLRVQNFPNRGQILKRIVRVTGVDLLNAGVTP